MRFLCSALLMLVTVVSQSEEYDSAIFDRSHIKTMSVVAPEWEDYTNKDGTGVYWEIMKAIYEPVGITVKTKNVPWNRAMKMVSKYRTYNAIVGEYRDTEENVIFPEYAIDIEYMALLSKNSLGKKFKDTSSLSGMKVGWIKDYEVIPESDRDFTLREFRTIQQGIEMLNAGKIDFLIDEWDEIAAAMLEAKLTTQDYAVDEMPEGTDLYTAFSDDNLSRELIAIYNERIPVLAKDGTLAKIYKKWDAATMPQSLIMLSE